MNTNIYKSVLICLFIICSPVFGEHPHELFSYSSINNFEKFFNFGNENTLLTYRSGLIYNQDYFAWRENPNINTVITVAANNSDIGLINIHYLHYPKISQTSNNITIPETFYNSVIAN